MKKIIENVKSYFRNLNKCFSLLKIICVSIIFSVSLLLIDYNDYPSCWLKGKPTNLLLILCASIIIFFIIAILDSGLLKSLKMKILSTIDVSVFVMLFSAIIYFTFMHIMKISAIYKIIALIFILSISLLVILKRIHNCSISSSSNNPMQSNIFDLKAIYENKFKRHNNLPILISEDSVHYDLLNRKFTINHIISSIESCSYDKSYVIGLEGAWGSGKTTIINNVKKEIERDEKYIIIEDLDPWLYGTQESLLSAMFEMILKHTGIKFNLAKANSMVSALVDVVAENHKSGSLIREIVNQIMDSDIYDIKSKISAYLEKENKKIVFLIDNLDRANESNIIFMFKLISVVFDLPNIIYILSYDKARIESVFKNTLEIDPKYIEKIIQQEISVPQIQANHLESLYLTCMNNILKGYGINAKNLKEYEFIFKFLCNNVKDIRGFKRIINSVFSSVFCFDTTLYKRDLLAIEIIRFCNPNLYAKIYENRQFFITYDKMFDSELYSHSFTKDNFNNEGKAFFKSLFDENKNYIGLLVELFPYAKKANNNSNLIEHFYGDDEEYKIVSQKSQISSVKYFDLYFSYGNNEFLFIGKDVTDTINKLNALKSSVEILDFIKSKFETLSDYMHREWLERFQVCFNELNEEIVCDVLIGLFNCLKIIDNSSSFLMANAQRRAIYIILMNICKLDSESINRFINNPQNDISSIHFMQLIIEIMEKAIDENNYPAKNTVIQQLKTPHNEKCQRIVKEKINIYDDEYFYLGNIWAIKHCIDKDKFDEYIASLVPIANIYRMVAESITSSSGTTNRQFIYKDNFESLFADKSIVEKALEDASPKNEKEKFVIELFDKFNSTSSEYEEGIEVQEFIDFNSL